MDRPPAVNIALAGALVGAVLGVAAGSAWAAKLARAKATPKAKQAAPALALRALDLERRRVIIEVAGLRRSPEPNLFTFTDVRGRHYIAVAAVCDPPFPSGTRVCELEIPRGYERHKLVSLELHLRSLHGRTVAAPAAEVASSWAYATAAARQPAAASGSPADAMAPRPGIVDGGSDGAATPPARP